MLFSIGELVVEAIMVANTDMAVTMAQVSAAFHLLKPNNRKKLGSSVKKPQENSKNENKRGVKRRLSWS